MFGQYSANARPRLSKAAVAAALTPQGVKSADVSKVANNTFRYVNNAGAVVYRLHSTDIATLHGNGDITVDNGGWNTPTTRGRLHGILRARGAGWGCSTRKGVMHVRTPAGTFAVARCRTFGADGWPTGEGSVADTQARNDAEAIEKLAKATAALTAYTAGDPWLQHGVLIDAEVARDWLDGCYATSWLAYSALLWGGFRPPGAAFHVRRAMNGEKDAQALIRRRVKAYLTAALAAR
jgi:hypothetical protein